MLRALRFLPGLARVRPEDIDVRVGLRPFAASGKPSVGVCVCAHGVVVEAVCAGRGAGGCDGH